MRYSPITELEWSYVNEVHYPIDRYCLVFNIRASGHHTHLSIRHRIGTCQPTPRQSIWPLLKMTLDMRRPIVPGPNPDNDAVLALEFDPPDPEALA